MIWALALLGTSLEKIAVEIRHLQKTEVLEVEEPFTRGQKGSSLHAAQAQPRPLRTRSPGWPGSCAAMLAVALENNILWHERDISHSSAERVIFPDSFHLAVFMLDDMTDMLKNLVVYPDNIRRNLELTQEVYFSQKVLTLLVNKGAGPPAGLRAGPGAGHEILAGKTQFSRAGAGRSGHRRRLFGRRAGEGVFAAGTAVRDRGISSSALRAEK